MIVAAVAVLVTRAKSQVKIGETTGKFGVNCSEAFKVLRTCSRNTPALSTKTTQRSRSVEQFTDNTHLATSARSICLFWIGDIPQLIMYRPYADKFIINSRPTSKRQDEIKKRKRNACCNVPWLVSWLAGTVS